MEDLCPSKKYVVRGIVDPLHLPLYMSQNLNCLKDGHIRGYMRAYYRVIKGDTRVLDYSLYCTIHLPSLLARWLKKV